MTTHFERSAIEDFLYVEAAHLDDWRLNEWLQLYTDDAEYFVPATDLSHDASPETSLFYIADDSFRLKERVARLMKKTAYAEYPRSKTRHLISNVRVEEQKEDSCTVWAAFVTYRSKMGVTDSFIGSVRYHIVRQNGDLRIREKCCVLDQEALRPQGRISIIL